MGQYFLIVNVDKREYIDGHRLGAGIKLWELAANGVGNLLIFLCRKSSEGGGGDIQKDYKHAGRWAGDRIVVVGDYDSSRLYQKARSFFHEISAEIVDEWNDFVELDRLKFEKEGGDKTPSKSLGAEFQDAWLDKLIHQAWLERCEEAQEKTDIVYGVYGGDWK